MSDELDSLSDSDLSEVVAVEVAGWKRAGTSRDWVKNAEGFLRAWGSLPSFAADPTIVLPLLEKCGNWNCNYYQHHALLAISGQAYHVVIKGDVNLGKPEYLAEAYAPTFARAACLALVKAQRSKIT